MVIERHLNGDEAVIVEGCVPLPLLSAASLPHVPAAHTAAESSPRKRREAPPLVGRDNSTTRYQAVKNLKLGSRRQRRWDNLLALKQALKALGHDEEDREEPIFRAAPSALSALFHSPQLMHIWESFAACTSQEQEVMVRLANLKLSDSMSFELAADSPIRCYLRVDRSIRLAMRRRHLPLGLVEHLEGEIMRVFVGDAFAEMRTQLADSYSRMLQHGICQYLGLKSASTDVDGVRTTIITHPSPHLGFDEPTVPLSAILSHAAEPSPRS